MESNVQENLNAVEMFDSLLGFCAGDNGTFLQSNPDGLTWFSFDLEIDSDLNDICIIQPNNGWVVGDNGAIFHSNNQGFSWESQFYDTSVHFNSVNFLDEMHGWVAGRKNNFEGAVFQTTDGGENWVEVSENGLPSFSVVFFTGMDIGWAVMGTGEVFKSIDGGVSWAIQFPDPWLPKDYRDIFFTDSDNGWAVGKSFSVPVPVSVIKHTSDGGETWDFQESNAWGGLNGIFFVDPVHSCAVGNTGSITCTPNGGNSWMVASGAHVNPALNDVFFIDDQKGWAAGGMDYPGTSMLLNTMDGGTTWNEMEIQDGIFYDVFFLNPANGWLATGPTVTSGGCEILYTNNGGASWESQYTGSNTFPMHEIYFMDDSKGWAIGGSIQSAALQGPVFLSTMNGGETWIDQSWISDKYLAEMCFPDPDHAWIVGHETILFSDDGSQTWMEVWTGVHSWKAVSFTDADHGWVLGDSISGYEYPDVLMYTTDGGESWNKQYFNHQLEDVFFTDNTRGWLSGADGLILYSQDGGNTWDPMFSRTNHNLKELFFTNQDKGWAVGQSSTILHIDNGGMTDIPIAGKHISGNQLKSYPNPFTCSTTIQFTLSMAGFVSLDVYDIQGKYLESIVSDHFTAGRQQLIWNNFGLERGVYFLNLQTENEKTISKIIKR